jgi:hypothetical protein
VPNMRYPGNEWHISIPQAPPSCTLDAGTGGFVQGLVAGMYVTACIQSDAVPCVCCVDCDFFVGGINRAIRGSLIRGSLLRALEGR